ncbi:MAG: hypothetical protein ACM3SY_07700 [Candidatus Omnitrophota bacterium]
MAETINETACNDKVENCNYDSAWKEVLKKLFKDCLEFFFPEIHNAIDFTKEVLFLDKELNQIQPNSNQGDREADILAKVHLKDGGIKYICLIIHVEVQSQQIPNFMEKMFIYYYRSYDHEKTEKIPVISLGILTDEYENFRPDTFEFRFCGFEIKMKIPIVKILDYKLKDELRKKLETSTNPMAMVVKAQLKSLEVKRLDSESRFEVTNELIRQCIRAGYSKDTIRTLITFVEWVIRLPESYKDRILSVIKQSEEETKMEYVPIWARDIRSEGKLEGILEGELKGRDEGLKEGLKEGRDETIKKTVERMLNDGLEIQIAAKYFGITIEEIKRLIEKTQ